MLPKEVSFGGCTLKLADYRYGDSRGAQEICQILVWFTSGEGQGTAPDAEGHAGDEGRAEGGQAS